MTKINDYLWQLPHTPTNDDPVDVIILQQSFNQPIASALEEPLLALGYELKSSDVAVRLDDRLENTKDSYYANVRFIRYVARDVIVRVHFEHVAWAQFMAEHDTHQYFINLDRFKVNDPATQVVVPAWEGRLHTRLSSLPGDVLHHTGDDQIWAFSSAEELEQQLQLFMEKFDGPGKLWLEDVASMS